MTLKLTTAGTSEATQPQNINESVKNTNFRSDKEVMLETSAY